VQGGGQAFTGFLGTDLQVGTGYRDAVIGPGVE